MSRNSCLCAYTFSNHGRWEVKCGVETRARQSRSRSQDRGPLLAEQTPLSTPPPGFSLSHGRDFWTRIDCRFISYTFKLVLVRSSSPRLIRAMVNRMLELFGKILLNSIKNTTYSKPNQIQTNKFYRRVDQNELHCGLWFVTVRSNMALIR